VDKLQTALQEVSDQLTRKMTALLPSEVVDDEVADANVIQLRPATTSEPAARRFGESTLIEAMRYAALGGGKRLRPFLTVAAADLFGVNRESSLMVAAAIEFVHSYSLVHDDLPAMDDDPIRRGKPSTHIQFGEAAAILAGDALLTFAFQVLSDERVHPNPAVRIELVQSLAMAAGFRGMAGGQMMDIEAEGRELSIDEIIRLQRLKTGELFAHSCEAGAILGKAPRALRLALYRYAHDMGLAFQITDDLLDAEGTREETGKSVQKDAAAGKATFVSAMGIERAREQAQVLSRQAIGHLKPFDKQADILRTLAEYVISRRG
jgi:farnesyl diphosphate synthase